METIALLSQAGVGVKESLHLLEKLVEWKQD